jgi:aminoglycoside 6'-N-acetyltransferase
MRLRRASFADIPLLRRWDLQLHVRAATGADDVHDWQAELAGQSELNEYLIAELDDGRPIGVMQIIDPAREETRYWGEGVEPNLRALDIWIGEESDLGRGYGTEMMRLALARCFADRRVTAVLLDPLVSNVRAHRFYERLGFRRIGRRFFGEDDCYVYRLERGRAR